LRERNTLEQQLSEHKARKKQLAALAATQDDNENENENELNECDESSGENNGDNSQIWAELARLEETMKNVRSKIKLINRLLKEEELSTINHKKYDEMVQICVGKKYGREFLSKFDKPFGELLDKVNYNNLDMVIAAQKKSILFYSDVRS